MFHLTKILHALQQELKEGSEYLIHIHIKIILKDVIFFILNFKVMVGGIGIVEMLYRSNILALVGSAKNQEYTPNKVILWDDHQSKVISELRFNTNVKNVKLKKDKYKVLILI